MADSILEQIYAYEDNILTNIASFIKAVIQMPVYLKDKPFLAPENPYATIRVISSDNSKGWSQPYVMEDNKMSYIMENKYSIEVMLYRGRPMPVMSYLLSAFMGLDELKWQLLYSKGISFLSASSISQANTILDGDKTQLRSRMILTFNTRMISQDIATDEIVQVNVDFNSYRDRLDDPSPRDFTQKIIYTS